mmetsp:Transcript_93562/g.213954  ORF Transcript_93562/g.213954 Transcript_93562/m.213954 type:complete len:172 (+) Transcript_93562:211-726(+)
MLQFLVGCMGYEDEDEFEDAIHCSFDTFIRALPNCECKEEAGVLLFRFKKLVGDPKPTRLTLRVAAREDLWRVLLRSADCVIRIPELEFEVQAEYKRCIDSVYNHLIAARTGLETYCRGGTLQAEEMEKVEETITQISGLLDLDQAFTCIVEDPTGASCFKPMDGVLVEDM